MGEGSNIGAGTITANYDGVNKHTTVVGSHVRPGRTTSSSPPLGLATERTRAPERSSARTFRPGALAVNGGPQRNIDGWVAANRPGTAAAEAAKAAGEVPQPRTSSE